MKRTVDGDIKSITDNSKRGRSHSEVATPPSLETGGFGSKRPKISDADFRALIELGDKQAAREGGGGVGIPGGRKFDDVREFPLLEWGSRSMSKSLTGILKTSQTFHAEKPPIEKQRETVKAVNRRVTFQDEQMGAHSLHVANDIAAVFNSTVQEKSKVYDYDTLAPKLSERVESGSRKGKKYFGDGMDADTRRAHIAEGMQHLLTGNIEKANAAFDRADATKRGKKWINKFSNILLAERGREIAGSTGTAKHGAVFKALEPIRKQGKTFEEVFASKHTKELAPFALRGGAKTFKK